MATTAPTRTWDAVVLGPRAVLMALLPVAAGMGALLAYEPKLGLAACAGLVFVAVVFFSFPFALGGLVVLMFVSGLPGLIGVPAASTAVVGMAWFATLPLRREQSAALRQASPLVLIAPWLLLAWMAATAIWAPDAHLATSRLWQVFTAVITVPIITLGADRPHAARLVVLAYVAGAAMIVLLAIVLGPSSFAYADQTDGRLAVANFSANLLGATAATALVLVPAVYRMATSLPRRLAVLAMGGLLMYGLVATQSRSGFIALGVAAIAALIVCRGRRRAITGGIAVALAAFAVFIALQPGILHRTETGDSTGRSDLWKAAIAVWKDHPIGGAGVGNFTAVSPKYSLRIGPLDAPQYVSIDPLPPHNLLLEALAETGVIGLVLLVLALGACLVATYRASRILGRRGDTELELLAQLVLVGQVSIITAGLFLPITASRQMWTLLAVGPALLGIALLADRPGTRSLRRSSR